MGGGTSFWRKGVGNGVGNSKGFALFLGTENFVVKDVGSGPRGNEQVRKKEVNPSMEGEKGGLL